MVPTDVAAEIRYEAPASCPDASSFRARVSMRLAAGQTAAAARVIVVERDGHFHGQVRFTSSGTSREIDALDCQSLDDALAFLVAFVDAPPANQVDEAPAPAPPLSTPPPPERTRPALAPVAPVAGSAGKRWVVSFGAGATTSSLVAPSLVVGPEVFVELARDRDALLSPALRLSGNRLESSAVSDAAVAAAAGQASFTQTSGQLSACPLLVRPWPTLAASPCAALRLGEMRGAASGIVHARSDAELSAGAELLARLRWSPRSFPGLLEAEVGAELPFSRFSYDFVPDSSLYRTAAVGWVAGLRAGTHFP